MQRLGLDLRFSDDFAPFFRSVQVGPYRVGKVDFQTLLSSVLDLQNLRQEYYRSLADHEIAIAKLQQVIGDRR